MRKRSKKNNWMTNILAGIIGGAAALWSTYEIINHEPREQETPPAMIEANQAYKKPTTQRMRVNPERIFQSGLEEKAKEKDPLNEVREVGDKMPEISYDEWRANNDF